MISDRDIEALRREVKELREDNSETSRIVRFAQGGGGGGSEIIFGKLDANLFPGLSTTMTQYHPITSATIKTGIVVYQANTGAVIPANTFVFVSKLKGGEGKRYVISRYC